MLKNILKLDGVQALNKSAQRVISGGVGNCAIRCNSGAVIGSAPDTSQSTQEKACANQGGPSGITICTGALQ